MAVLEFFDSHCHLHELATRVTPVHDKWLSDGTHREVQFVLDAAKSAGVKRLVVIGTTLEDSELAVRFAEAREGVWAAVGLHPHEAKNYTTKHLEGLGGLSSQKGSRQVKTEVMKRFEQLVEGPKVVAVGECGLDYFYTLSPKEDQEAVLRFQLETALAAGLPLSFHIREAFSDFWRILADYPKVHGVLHSFTDTPANMERAIEHGLYVGINGIATFTKNPEQLVTYRTIPQHSLLLETDAPFLTPKPFRGRICEPKHVVQTAEFIAALRGESLADIAAVTTRNACKLYNVK